MQVGILQGFQNFRDRYDDRDVVADALRIADLYEPLGYDFLLCAEHHFHGYSMSPNPFDFLCYMAGRTNRIRLGPGVIIVPWNDPYRSAAHLIALDHLSRGRALMGVGRGLSRLEMDLLGVDMSDTRAMYDEGVRKIIAALTTGTFPGEGRFYNHQKSSPMRPAPYSTDWAERILCVGMTPPSATEAGRIGGRLMSFAAAPWASYKETHLQPYKETFAEHHGREAPPIVTGDVVFVHEDEERARELAHLYIGNYSDIVGEFYETSGEHLKSAKGYEAYVKGVEAAKAIGADAARQGYIDLQLWGTPSQIVEKVRARRELLDHPFDLCALINVGDMPAQLVEDTVRLFAREVMPVLRKFDEHTETRVLA